MAACRIGRCCGCARPHHRRKLPRVIVLLRRLLTWLDKAIWAVSIGSAFVSATLLLVVFVIIQYEVIMRFIFNSPTYWTHEVSTFSISWVGFLGAGYVLRLGRQLEVDVLTMRISHSARRLLGTATDVVGGAFCGFAAFLGYEFSRIAYLMRASSATEMDVALWIPYMTIPIGFSVLALEFLARILARWNLAERQEPPPLPIR